MLFIIQLMGHMIADFFLQSSNMAENKKKCIIVLLAHSSIYLGVFAAINLLFIQPKIAVCATLIISITHFVIDLVRTKIDNGFDGYKVRFLTFVIDQGLHILVVIATYYMLDLSAKTSFIYRNCEGYANFNKVVLYCLLFVILLEPSAVFVKKMFGFIFQEETNDSSGNNAGKAIGKLERIITAILLLCNQYGAIGFVLTAKSIARFKQLEDQDFAEKYLIGTLLSFSISLIATIIVKYILAF